MTPTHCRHCNQRLRNRGTPRILCWACQLNPVIRAKYPQPERQTKLPTFTPEREAERALPVTYDELEELCVNGGNIIAAPWQLKGKMLVDVESAVEIKTRGQLLDLLSGLGINVKEQGNG